MASHSLDGVMLRGARTVRVRHVQVKMIGRDVDKICYINYLQVTEVVQIPNALANIFTYTFP